MLEIKEEKTQKHIPLQEIVAMETTIQNEQTVAESFIFKSNVLFCSKIYIIQVRNSRWSDYDPLSFMYKCKNILQTLIICC